MVAPHEREVVIKVSIETDTESVARSGRITQDSLRRTHDAARRGAETASTATTRAVEQSSQAMRTAATQQSRHQRTALSHLSSMSTQFTQLTSNAARLARGIGLVFISGEKDREKFIKSLAQIIGYTDILAGGVGALANMTQMWASYSRAVGGAAASHAALNAARGGGVALAATAGSNVAGYSLLGGAGGAGTAGVAAGGGALATAGAGVAALVSTMLAEQVARQTWSDFRKYGLMGGATPGTLSYQIGEKEAGFFEWLSSNIGGKGGLAAGFGRRLGGSLFRQSVGVQSVRGALFGLEQLAPDPFGTRDIQGQTERRQRLLASNRRAEEVARIRAGGRAARLGIGTPGVAEATRDYMGVRGGQPVERIAGLGQMQRSLQAEYGQVTDKLKEKVRLERESLDLLRQQVVEVSKQQRATETWVGAKPMQLAQLQSAKARLQAGTATGRDLTMLGQMRGMGIGWLDQAVNAAFRQKLLADPKAREFFGQDYLGKIGKAPTVADLTVKIEAQELTIKTTGRDIEAEARIYAEKIAKVVAEQNKALIEAIKENTEAKLKEHSESFMEQFLALIS